MAHKLRNNVSTTLAASITSGDLTLSVPAGKGVLWDDCVAPDYAYTTIMDASGNAVEVVKVTARSGDSLTIERGQDATFAQGWASGSAVERRLNAAAVTQTTIDFLLAENNIFSGNNAHDGVETFFGEAVFQNTMRLQQAAEKVTITAGSIAAAATFDVLAQAIQYYPSNASANFTLNVRGDATNSLDFLMVTGESVTINLLVTMGATARWQTAMTIDGVAVTPKWIGTAPTSGFASAINMYNYTIIKTGAGTFTVIASLTRAA